MSGRDRRFRGELADLQTQAIRTAIAEESQRATDLLRSLAASVAVQEPLSVAAFSKITDPIALARLPGAAAVAYVVPAQDGDLTTVQTGWLGAENVPIDVQPRGDVATHLVIVRQRSFGGAIGPLGGDLAGSPEAVAALDQARASATVTASRPHVLPEDEAIDPPRRQLSLLLTAPVFHGRDPSSPGEIRGWIVLALRGQDFLNASVMRDFADLPYITLGAEVGADPAVQIAAVSTGNVEGPETLDRRTTVGFAGRTLHVSLGLAADAPVQDPARSSDAVVAVGIAISLLAGIVVRVLLRARQRALAAVDEATGALAEYRLRSDVPEAALTAAAPEESGIDIQQATDVPDIARTLTTALATSDGSANEAVSLRVKPLVEGVVDRLSAMLLTRRLRLKVEVADNVGAVRGDRAILARALENLLDNAVRYTPDGGSVSLVVSQTSRWVVVVVSDTGVGIPEAEQDRLFEPLFRASTAASSNADGSGLGLLITKSFVEAYGGEIDVFSTYGRGTRVTVRLPIDTALLPTASVT